MTDPPKDLTHDARFLHDNFIPGLSTARLLGDITITIRRTAQHIDRARVRGMSLGTFGPVSVAQQLIRALGPITPPMPLDNFRTLILGHHPLHLQQQIVLG